MSENTKRTFIIIEKSLMKRLTASVANIAMMVGSIGLGVWLDSAALQWSGAAVFFLAIFAHGSGKLKEMTREEAIAYLQSEEAK